MEVQTTAPVGEIGIEILIQALRLRSNGTVDLDHVLSVAPAKLSVSITMQGDTLVGFTIQP